MALIQAAIIPILMDMYCVQLLENSAGGGSFAHHPRAKCVMNLVKKIQGIPTLSAVVADLGCMGAAQWLQSII